MPETRMIVKLKDTVAVVDLVGDRIRHLTRKKGWEGNDAITYQRISTDTSGGADVTNSTRFVRIQLDIWSSTPMGARTLAAAVRGALDYWSDTGGSPAISMCRWLAEMDAPEGPDAGGESEEYRMIQEYYVQYSE
jgi:hypothetical protein